MVAVFRILAALVAPSLSMPSRSRFPQALVGLIGPDGVGKSSLLTILAGAREIQEGRSLFSTPIFPMRRPRRDLSADCLHAARAGQESLSRSEREREYRVLRQAVRPSARRTRVAIRELLESTGLAPFADRPAKNSPAACGKSSDFAAR